MQGARDGRGRQGQHVHVLFQGLELFLVPHAEALFLVQDEQGKIGQGHVRRQQAVRAQQDVDLPLGRGLEDFLLPGTGHETAQQAHRDRETG